jgi:PTH1 family peptidyl-tRNA hydrolase
LPIADCRLNSADAWRAGKGQRETGSGNGMKLIAGLGNPGRDYAKTRHNAGFRVLDLLAGRLGEGFDRTQFKGEYARAAVPAKWEKQLGSGGDLLLVKPQTYMNLSGETVQCFCGYYKIELPDLLVVVDDVALALGALRIRRGGSAGGHKGLKDIEQRLGSQDFARLRIGVGGRDAGAERPPEDLREHVLSRFSAAEEEVLKKSLELAADACLCWAGQGVEETMNRYNAAETKKAKSQEKNKDAGKQETEPQAPGPVGPDAKP